MDSHKFFLQVVFFFTEANKTRDNMPDYFKIQFLLNISTINWWIFIIFSLQSFFHWDEQHKGQHACANVETWFLTMLLTKEYFQYWLNVKCTITYHIGKYVCTIRNFVALNAKEKDLNIVINMALKWTNCSSDKMSCTITIYTDMQTCMQNLRFLRYVI